MERKDILEKVQLVFRDVLDNDELELQETMSAEDIEDYDSLSHIQLVVAIEKSFGIKFTSAEIMNWDNIGSMLDSIESKL